MQIEWMKFIAKYLTIIVSAVWLLVAGTDYINKQVAEIDLRNKALGKDSVARATGEIIDFKGDNEPWVDETDLCTVGGRYKIVNDGGLPVFIESISYSVYEFPIFLSSQMLDRNIASRTLDKLIADNEAIHVDYIHHPTKLNIDGVMLRSFQFIIRRKKGHLYTVVANASGGLLGVDGKTDSEYRFSMNELASDVGLISICGGDATMDAKSININ